MRAEWMRVELSLRGRPLGAITFYDGDVDLAEITKEAEREELIHVFGEYSGKPFEFAWVGFGNDLAAAKHGPKTVAWFEDVLRVVLKPEGYRYTITDEGQRMTPDRDTP